MNYFELYELPVQLSVDKRVLKKKYLELSRRYHPDYFIGEESGAQQETLERSAAVNKAYTTFSSADETIRYVLELKGLLREAEKYDLPPDFLMDMMELNETVAGAQFDTGEMERALQTVLQREAELYIPVQEIVAQYKEGVSTDEDLRHVKDYYFKKKYLQRLKGQLNGKL